MRHDLIKRTEIMAIVEFEILSDKKYDECWSVFLDSDLFRGSEVLR